MTTFAILRQDLDLTLEDICDNAPFLAANSASLPLQTAVQLVKEPRQELYCASLVPWAEALLGRNRDLFVFKKSNNIIIFVK